MNSEDKDLPPKPHHQALWLVVIALNVAAGVLCIAIAITEARASATRPNTVRTVLAVSTAAISLGSAAILFFRWRRERTVYRETIKFFCPRCYYDRRGLPENAPCPECGAFVESTP